MVLADTSVWVSHLRWGNALLETLLLEEMVVCHLFIIGELACGNLKNRKEVISLLQALPTVNLPDHHEALEFIESKRLMGLGIGYVDVHLLAAAVLNKVSLWTIDKQLRGVATRLNVQYDGKTI